MRWGAALRGVVGGVSGLTAIIAPGARPAKIRFSYGAWIGQESKICLVASGYLVDWGLVDSLLRSIGLGVGFGYCCG